MFAIWKENINGKFVFSMVKEVAVVNENSWCEKLPRLAATGMARKKRSRGLCSRFHSLQILLNLKHRSNYIIAFVLMYSTCLNFKLFHRLLMWSDSSNCAMLLLSDLLIMLVQLMNANVDTSMPMPHLYFIDSYWILVKIEFAETVCTQLLSLFRHFIQDRNPLRFLWLLMY